MMNPSPGKFGYIDCLRGIAILMVIATHIKGVVPGCSALAIAATSFGRMGVQLFFLVSACTLYRSWQARSGEDRQTARFYIRRFFRIAPLYYFGIALYGASATFKYYISAGIIAWPVQYDLTGMLSNIALLHSFYLPANNNIVPGGWSIATEFLFYLIFPIFIQKIQSSKVCFTAVLTLVYLISLATVHSLITHSGFRMELGDFWYHSLPNQLPVFLVGITTAVHLYNNDCNAGHDNRSSRIWCHLGASAAWVACTFAIWNHPDSVAMSILPFLAACSFAFLTKAFSLIEPEFLSRHFGWLARVGVLSYSMYIWHFLVIDILKVLVPQALVSHQDFSLMGFFLFTCLLTFTLSELSARWIETPGIRLGKRIIRHL